MKRKIFFTLATAFLMCFAACTNDDPEPNGNGDNNGSNNNGGNSTNYSQLIVGTWKVDYVIANDVQAEIDNLFLQFANDNTGLLIDNGVTENNEFNWNIQGNQITITPRRGSSTYTIQSLTASEALFSGDRTPGSDETQGDVVIHMAKYTGDIPQNPPHDDFLAGTNWVCYLDTLIANSNGTNDFLTFCYTIYIDPTNPTEGQVGVTNASGSLVTNQGQSNEETQNYNGSAWYHWTYNNSNHTGVFNAKQSLPATDNPITMDIPFIYDPINNNIIINLTENMGAPIYPMITQLVFSQTD